MLCLIFLQLIRLFTRSGCKKVRFFESFLSKVLAFEAKLKSGITTSNFLRASSSANAKISLSSIVKNAHLFIGKFNQKRGCQCNLIFVNK